MEVHTHAHTARNKWTHYLWEFLMLFLAVFCGFLAENFREHKVEALREKQFVVSLVNDLQADTAKISDLLSFRERLERKSDSFFNLLTSKGYAEHIFEVYQTGSFLSRRAFFYSADGTMQQLKNAGGLRLISHLAVADSIKAYDVQYRSILQLQQLEEEQVARFRELASRFFDAASLKNFYFRRNLHKDSASLGLRLNQSDPALLNELSNTILYRSGNSVRIILEMNMLKWKAIHLIQLIKKEYHLD